MFQNLGDLGFVRSSQQAIGRYLAYWIGFELVYFLVQVIYVSIVGPDSIGASDPNVSPMGVVLRVIVTGLLAYLILQSKGSLDNVGLVIVVASMGVAYLGGSLFSFMILAYLTTKPVRAMEK